MSWHIQLAIFWIATSWLATGLFIAPAVSGHEPRSQRLGVNVLFVALLVIVVGSLVGQWLGVMQRLGLEANFWFGHQGYEYVDLGRFWQIFLFAGLFIWLALMGRAIWPAFRERTASRPLLGMFLISCVAIALFYGAGLMWGRQTNLAMAEYWRWWVVHLWVEGFLEVFATVVIAFLFVLKGLAARQVWKDGVIRFAFWSINIGLTLMVLLSVLPVGLAQTVASVQEGLWYARSAEFLQQGWLDTLRWLRVIGDTIFAVGIMALAWFVVGLKTGWSLDGEREDLPRRMAGEPASSSATAGK